MIKKLKEFKKDVITLTNGVFSNKDIQNLEFEEICELYIICPQCNKKGYIKIPIKIFNSGKSLALINVQSNVICEHSFFLYMDKNFTVRESGVYQLEITPDHTKIKKKRFRKN